MNLVFVLDLGVGADERLDSRQLVPQLPARRAKVAPHPRLGNILIGGLPLIGLGARIRNDPLVRALPTVVVDERQQHLLLRLPTHGAFFEFPFAAGDPRGRAL